MVEQRWNGTRYLRAFGLFALLAGIALMHSVVLAMSHGPGEHHPAALSTADVPASAMPSGTVDTAAAQDRPTATILAEPDHRAAASPLLPAASTESDHRVTSFITALTGVALHPAATVTATLTGGDHDPMASCAGTDCGSHAGLHGCVFVLAALLLGLGLALLSWAGFHRDGPSSATPRQWRPHRARPPPWTVLSLAELAILRI
ncbi:hypothetical protein [Nocardia jejuensis]|uniref:hypothetical protein n=1 Tax=Nocardia jejuensis TaxID=328049 RepID=UPI0008349B5C|nr:hypothetical protein [Nocardia jejuensis]